MVTPWLRLFDKVLFSDNPLLEELKPKHADKVLEALATDLPLKYVVAFTAFYNVQFVQCNRTIVGGWILAGLENDRRFGSLWPFLADWEVWTESYLAESSTLGTRHAHVHGRCDP